MPIYFSCFMTALLLLSVIRTITTYRKVGAFLYCVKSRCFNSNPSEMLPTPRVSLTGYCMATAKVLQPGFGVGTWWMCRGIPRFETRETWGTRQDCSARGARRRMTINTQSENMGTNENMGKHGDRRDLVSHYFGRKRPVFPRVSP